MFPTLFTLFGIHFASYALLLVTGFVLAALLIVREADLRGRWFPPDAFLWVLAGALVGARLFHLIQFNEEYTAAYGPAWHRHLWRAVLVWRPGLTLYGGLAGGTAAAWVCCRYYRMPFLLLSDIAAPYLALAQAVSRVGCFLNGCCWGTLSGVPWAVRFPPGCNAYEDHVAQHWVEAGAPFSMPVHPTQIYLVAGLLAVFLFLKRRLAHKRWRGEVAVYYALCYGLLRFVAEFVRGDSARSIGGMTVPQTLSLVLAIAALAVLAWAWRARWWRGAFVDQPVEEE